MVLIRVGGVPEHNNVPIHLGIERGLFAAEGLDVQFTEYPGGTGAMRTALRSNQLDVAVALTEGLTADIGLNGPDVQIVGTYITSPLVWAMSTSASGSISDVSEARGKKFGISNIGSGSHIMVTVLADQQGWQDADGTAQVSFAPPVVTFEKLRNGVKSGDFDAFLWEYFMSKPYYDRKEIRFSGLVSAPWPAFMIAARGAYAQQNIDVLQRLLKVITHCAKLFVTERDQSIARVSSSFGLTQEDAAQWFEKIRYSDNVAAVSRASLQQTVASLVKAKVLKQEVTVEQLVNADVCTLVD
eukprot:TRINITY_DN12802_c0_g1_i1.p1 TRINITY_DN12802_c0_g1~~TRINITY_DN12802_c0_g1_i1.p1  ORF type:complete len:299 (+),score=67.31 TRINITY_DN12802_c0_g1_i1:370-1266(+)